ncbi:MAG: DUF3332 domain-containing protein [Bacteroidales bacterium]|nr:DUF3332 domain-containing protein [Bacteroidales bacterium]
MKKKYLSAALALTLAFSLTTSSCIGSFSLTNKLLGWNKQVGSKFVNELVFFAFWIIPVYEVSALADILVINSIEFWSGNNPLSASTKTIEGKDGQQYLVECDGAGYTITSLSDGTVTRLDYTADTQTWSVEVGDEVYPLMTFVDDTHVALPSADGTSVLIEASDAGVTTYSQMVAPLMMARR